MSKLLRQLLGREDPLFSIGIARLEAAAGMPGIDTRLTADILSATRSKMIELGLDPKDTTGEELYQSLRARLLETDELIMAHLGHPANGDQATRTAVKLTQTILKETDVWSVKQSVLRALIKKNPPKKVMKAFRFQSVESMAKRMDIREVVLAARILEGKTWTQKQHKLLSALVTKDFESVPIVIRGLTDARWLPVLKEWEKSKGTTVIAAKECGIVGGYLDGRAGSYALVVPLLLHAANEVKLHGAYLKLHSVNPTIGLALADALVNGARMHTTLSGVSFHWRDIQRHFGLHATQLDSAFIHLDSNDLGWLDIETKLSLVMPEIAFWIGTDFLGVSYGEGKIVSCNIHDIARSVYLGLGYRHMFTDKMQRSLRSELMARYMRMPAARALVVKQFDISSITDENW